MEVVRKIVRFFFPSKTSADSALKMAESKYWEILIKHKFVILFAFLAGTWSNLNPDFNALKEISICYLNLYNRVIIFFDAFKLVMYQWYRFFL